MKTEQFLLQTLHTATKRDYLQRMIDQKVECMDVAEKYDQRYWDGDRRFGYGGYRYDGRWKPYAQSLINTYNLTASSRLLDIGCGKGHLIHEIAQLLPGISIKGLDISKHALGDAPKQIRPNLEMRDISRPLPYEDGNFDLVLSLNTLHNLHLPLFEKTLLEIERIGLEKYIVVESYRTNQELFNLQCWALTCRLFFKTEDWVWLYNSLKYTGDYEFIYFD